MRSRFPSPGTRRAFPLCVSTLYLYPIVLLSLLGLTPTASADAAALSGRVTDPDGRAVPNARVVVSGPLGTVAETRTTSTGEYELAQMPDGPVTLRVLADGFSAAPLALALASDEHRTVGVQLTLSAIEEDDEADPEAVARLLSEHAYALWLMGILEAAYMEAAEAVSLDKLNRRAAWLLRRLFRKTCRTSATCPRYIGGWYAPTHAAASARYSSGIRQKCPPSVWRGVGGCKHPGSLEI